MAKEKTIQNKNNNNISDWKVVTGILLMFVVASVSYMIYIVVYGTEGLYPKLMTIPAAIWVLWTFGRKFIGM